MNIGFNIKALAKQIAQKLDKEDGRDNKIKSDTWKKYAVPNFGAKDNVSIYISLSRAEKSIEYYLNRCTQNKNVDMHDLGEKWLACIGDETNEKADKKAENQKNGKQVAAKQNTRILDNDNDKITRFAEQKTDSTRVFVASTVKTNINSQKKITNDKFKASNNSEKTKRIEDLISQEIEKRHLTNVDVKYWSSKIAAVSEKYDIPCELLVSMISRETRFVKNVSGKNGHGAMQLTTVAINSFFPNANGNWNNIYKQLDEKLLNDILYLKNSDGKFKTDSKGNKILKYKTPNDLLRACGKDDELSLKVGALIFEMKYAEAVASKKYGRATYANVPRVITQLYSGDLTLSKNENMYCIENAVKNYNGNHNKIKRSGRYIAIKDDYSREIMGSLKVNGYDFTDQIITSQA